MQLPIVGGETAEAQAVANLGFHSSELWNMLILVGARCTSLPARNGALNVNAVPESAGDVECQGWLSDNDRKTDVDVAPFVQQWQKDSGCGKEAGLRNQWRR